MDPSWWAKIILRTCGAAAVLLAGACGEAPVGSQPRELPQAAEPAGRFLNLEVRPFPYHGLGSLSMLGIVDSATERSGEPVRVRVRTSTGDEEELTLFRAPRFAPHRLLLMMHDGVHIAELRARMDPARLRFGSFGLSGEFGVLHVVSGDPTAALERVRRWPEVWIAEISGFVRNPEAPRRLVVYGTLPLDEAPPAPGNGRVELRTGEAVTVEYLRADGAPASVTHVFDSRSEPDMRAFVPLLVREVERILYGDSAPRPPLLIDAASFAEANWGASGTRISPAEAVAGLPAGYQVVSGLHLCRQYVVPQHCPDTASGTLVYTGAMYRLRLHYVMTVDFRAPSTAPRCFFSQTFHISWSDGAWRVHSPWPGTRC